MRAIIFLLYLVYVTNGALNQKWLEVFKKCKRNDDICLAIAIEDAIKKLGQGINGLNIPAFDPVEVQSLNIGAGNSAVHLEQKYKNIFVSGLSVGKISRAHFDAGKRTLEFTAFVPKFIQKADYEVNGKILVAPVVGSGPCVITITNMTINHELKMAEETKDGKVYYKVLSYVADYDAELAHYKFDNLFDGDKALGDGLNKLLNDEWRAIFDDVKSGYAVAYAAIFKKYADMVFGKIPVKDLFAE